MEFTQTCLNCNQVGLLQSKLFNLFNYSKHFRNELMKIKGFQSPMQLIAKRIPFIKSILDFYYKHNIFDNSMDRDEAIAQDPRLKRKRNLSLGGFNPLIALLAKDFIDTFKPHKSHIYIIDDGLKPLSAIGNIIRGLFNLIASPILFITETIRNLVYL